MIQVQKIKLILFLVPLLAGCAAPPVSRSWKGADSPIKLKINELLKEKKILKIGVINEQDPDDLTNLDLNIRIEKELLKKFRDPNVHLITTDWKQLKKIVGEQKLGMTGAVQTGGAEGAGDSALRALSPRQLSAIEMTHVLSWKSNKNGIEITLVEIISRRKMASQVIFW